MANFTKLDSIPSGKPITPAAAKDSLNPKVSPPNEFVTVEGFTFRPTEIDGFQSLLERKDMEDNDLPDATQVFFNGYTTIVNDPEQKLTKYLERIKKPSTPYEAKND